MTIAPLAEKLGLSLLPNSLQTKFRVEELGSLDAASSSLVESIRDDTLSVKQIDSFIDQSLILVPASKRSDLLEYLLCTKAGLLFTEGKTEEGLKEGPTRQGACVHLGAEGKRIAPNGTP